MQFSPKRLEKGKWIHHSCQLIIQFDTLMNSPKKIRLSGDVYDATDKNTVEMRSKELVA